MMDYLEHCWRRLKSVEFVLNTNRLMPLGQSVDVEYWKKQRKNALRLILKYQLATFDRI